MVQPTKIAAVANLKEKLAKAKSLVLVDFAGLPVTLQNKLREAASNAGGEFTILKNTLLKIAFKQAKSGLPRDFDFEKIEKLRGPTAAVFSFEDELEPIKVLTKFIKDYELPTLKFGFFEDKLVNQATLEELAQIPGREQLYGQVVQLLNSPLSGLVSNLESNLNQLVWILGNIKSQ